MNLTNANSGRATTLFELSADRLRRLARATGLQARADFIVSVFQRLIDPWGCRRTGQRPEWSSYVGDDHTPVEFSVTFGDKPELRILLEPLGRVPSLVSNRDAAISRLRSLSSEYPIDLSRFDQIQDLFCPPEPMGPFSVWIAVAFSGSRPPDFKLYLNPTAQGRRLAPALVEEALARLGFPRAWPVVSGHLLRRGPDLDELNYLSLDLSASADARLKIYARHASCTTTDLEFAASAALSHRSGDVKEFLGLVAPGAGNVFEGRAPSTCYTFVGRGGDLPLAATTHFPINSYAPDDGVVAHRVLATLERFGIPAESYARSAAAFATRPLDLGIGMHSYVSFRRYRGDARLTTYLALEAYKPGMVECAGAAAGESGVIEAAARSDRSDLMRDHPFCRRLRREPADPRHLGLILANIEVANRPADVTMTRPQTLVEDAPIWAGVDRDVRAAGESVANEALRLRTLLPEPARNPGGQSEPNKDQSLVPGRSLKRQLVTIFGASDAHEVNGATAAAKTIGAELARLVSDTMGLVPSEPAQAPKAGDSPADAFIWGEIVPSRAMAATWKGERDVARAGWQFLDNLYALCYGDASRPAPPGLEMPHVEGG